MFAALSDPEIRPLVVPKIKAFYAFSPIVYLQHYKLPIPNLLAYLTQLAQDTLNILGVNYLETGECRYDPKDVA